MQIISICAGTRISAYACGKMKRQCGSRFPSCRLMSAQPWPESFH